MKKFLFIAFIAIFAAITANAQNVLQIEESWQKTITVPESKDPLIDRLFTAWGKEFPGLYVNAFKQYKETGKAKNIEYVGEKFNFKVNYTPKTGNLDITSDKNNDLHLYASVWEVRKDKILLGVSVFEEMCAGALALYEYNSAKGILSPRPDLVNKVRDFVGEENAGTTCFLPYATTIDCHRIGEYKSISIDDLLAEDAIKESIATEKEWQKTITVPELTDDITLDLFMAWCDEFPSWYSEAIDKIEETDKAKPIVWDGYKMDIKLFTSSLESLCMIGEYKDFKNLSHRYFLNFTTWTLKNGNPLFCVSVGEGRYTNMLAFYEYNASAGTLTPRPDVTDKAWDLLGDIKHKTFIDFYEELNYIHYFDYDNNKTMKIPWDTNEF